MVECHHVTTFPIDTLDFQRMRCLLIIFAVVAEIVIHGEREAAVSLRGTPHATIQYFFLDPQHPPRLFGAARQKVSLDPLWIVVVQTKDGFALVNFGGTFDWRGGPSGKASSSR